MPRYASNIELEIDKVLTDFTHVAVLEGLTRSDAEKIASNLLSTNKYHVMSTVVLSKERKPTYELHIQRK